MVIRQPLSMRRRMLISASLVLTLFISLTAVILDQAFKGSLQSDLHDRLQTQLYLVLGAAEFEKSELILPQVLNYPKLNQIDSGSIAMIMSSDGQEIWRSGSAQGFLSLIENTEKFLLPPGESQQGTIRIEGAHFFYSGLGVAWEVSPGNLRNYTFLVAENDVRFHNSISQYRMYLWAGLGMLAVILLSVFMFTLYWGLSPLKQLEDDLNLIETGQSEQLSGHYPKELTGVARNLNQLLKHEKRQHTRYRNTLSDLAHSLKTPLAVLRGIADQYYLEKSNVASAGEVYETQIKTLGEQVSRMDEIVQHQLKRASYSGPQSVQHTIEVLPLAESLAGVVEKVYQDSLHCIDVEAEEGVVFMGAKGDLMEVIGNLLDNAAKYGGGIIQLTVSNLEMSGKTLCRVVVEDNGSGVEEAAISELLRRGVRADQKQQGQGIGLAMVVDIVDQYQGKLHLGKSDLGGLKAEIIL